jgi:AcrR family transcriptional regulator
MAMGRPRAFDRNQALDRAMEVFWRNGYEGASLAELTKAMGINPPSLYAAFGNKEGLLRAALDRYAEKRAEFMSHVMDAPTAYEAAARMLRGTADLQTDPASPPGCLLVQGGLACGTGAEVIPAELASRRADTEQMMMQRFERARAEGDLPADANPATLARYVSAVTQGMGVQAAAGASREELYQIAEHALAAFPKQPTASI